MKTRILFSMLIAAGLALSSTAFAQDKMKDGMSKSDKMDKMDKMDKKDAMKKDKMGGKDKMKDDMKK